jgi:hypothetical protein
MKDSRAREVQPVDEVLELPLQQRAQLASFRSASSGGPPSCRIPVLALALAADRQRQLLRRGLVLDQAQQSGIIIRRSGPRWNISGLSYPRPIAHASNDNLSPNTKCTLSLNTILPQRYNIELSEPEPRLILRIRQDRQRRIISQPSCPPDPKHRATRYTHLLFGQYPLHQRLR